MEKLSDEDIHQIAKSLVYAGQLSTQVNQSSLDGQTEDLARIQNIIDSDLIESTKEDEIACLGLAFGRVFVENNQGFDWCIVNDEYGREVAIRFKDHNLLIFPQTMLLKRIEDGEDVDIQDLYFGLQAEIDNILEEDCPNQ